MAEPWLPYCFVGGIVSHSVVAARSCRCLLPNCPCSASLPLLSLIALDVFIALNVLQLNICCGIYVLVRETNADVTTAVEESLMHSHFRQLQEEARERASSTRPRSMEPKAQPYVWTLAAYPQINDADTIFDTTAL